MSQQTDTLYFAMELSKKTWRLCFGDGSKDRQIQLDYSDIKGLLEAISKAKDKFGLAEDAPVVSCYEAGRDGFWIHRMLKENGIENLVIDPASIQVSRRAKQRKTDRLDAESLLSLLIRYLRFGDKKALSEVNVPEEDQEARMRIIRLRKRLNNDRTSLCNKIRAIFTLYGIRNVTPYATPSEIKDWKGEGLLEEVILEIKTLQKQLEVVDEELKNIKKMISENIKAADCPADAKAKKMMQLKAIGQHTAASLGHEMFGWRTFKNRKKVGAFLGLTGTPYDSGETLREQGISKAGRGELRALTIQVAWMWVRHQPESELTKWFNERFAKGGKRMRKRGIVALARKLAVALWKYVEQDIIPEGAVLKV